MFIHDERCRITKRFGGAVAVGDVSVAVRAGEVHAIVGENGAGKSTLMRVLAGLLVPDEGTVRVHGHDVTGDARAALEAGVSLVHQELSLVPEMSVAENIMLGAFPARAGLISGKDLLGGAEAALREIGVSIDLREPVARLSVSLRQFVEIARAVARKPKVLILDEPTATLTPAETTYLLEMLRRLAAGGLAIVYISHRLPEVFGIGDRITVLRDGRHVDTRHAGDVPLDELVSLMVGRELQRDLQVVRNARPGEVVLSARGITAPRVHGVDLDVRAGQIVGLGGLVGAGRSELVRAVLGVDARTGGEVTVRVDGRVRRVGSYGSAVRSGIAYVPEERRTDGLALSLSVSDNIALPNRRALARAGVLNPRRQNAFATELASTGRPAPGDPGPPVGDTGGDVVPPARPGRAAARGDGPRRRGVRVVRAGVRRPRRGDHRPPRAEGQGRPVVAGERGGGLPAVQRRARAHRPGRVARRVPAARLGAGPGGGAGRAARAGGGDRGQGRAAPGPALPGRAAAAAGGAGRGSVSAAAPSSTARRSSPESR